ncbi:MAG: CapA family protein [Bradymonadales bacterium]|nr:CapA family protein [Bradymonadales bacterium]
MQRVTILVTSLLAVGGLHSPSHGQESADTQAGRFQVLLAGDLVLGKMAGDGYRPFVDPDTFSSIILRLQGADLTLVNLESPLCDIENAVGTMAEGVMVEPEGQGDEPAPSDQPPSQQESYIRLSRTPTGCLPLYHITSNDEPRRAPGRHPPIFLGPVRAAQWLADAGIDAVSVANNHIGDLGEEGIRTTLVALERAQVAAAGASLPEPGVSGHSAEMDPFAPAVVERSGVRTAILAATVWRNRGNPPPGPSNPVALVTLEHLAEELRGRIRELRAGGEFDLVLVSLHWGGELSPVIARSQQAVARLLIDSGAHLVWGHHPHVLQPVEVYRGGLILYSTGNLVSDMVQREASVSALVGVELQRDGEGGWQVTGLTLHPLSVGRPARGPVEIPPEEAASLLEPMATRSCVDYQTCLFWTDSGLIWERGVEQAPGP